MRVIDGRRNATLAAIVAVFVSLAACSPATPIVPRPVANTPAPPPSSTNTPATAPASQPRFSAEIGFATEPNQAKTQRVFRTGTRQVFAIWDYSNMRPNQSVRREWYRDNELWLVREETWDFAKYGGDGTVLDVSVYDFDAGLEPGLYTLMLFIDGQAQSSFEDYPRISFRIEGTTLEPLSSPDGLRTALVRDPRVLVIQEADGTQRELLTADEISSMAWFPDGKHMVYSNRLRARQQLGAGTVFVQDELWIVDVMTGERRQIGAADENLHTPGVSPDGQYVVVHSGSGWHDACLVDLSLAIVKLDSALRRVALFRLSDFAGLPRNVDGYLAAYPVATEDRPASGIWLSPTQFAAGLQFACTPDNPEGVYALDLTTQTAKRIGDLGQQ